jgi:Domain of unknown function (DUF4132)
MTRKSSDQSSASGARAESQAPDATQSVAGPGWITTAFADADKMADKAPFISWADPANLPPLIPLERQHVLAALTALRQSTLEQPHPLIRDLKANVDARELAVFAWALCEGWLAGGSPPIHKWTLIAQGLLGDDFTVHKLALLVREWPGQRQHPRAALGLQCLRNIGTDSALMELQAIARKIKFKALQAKAQQAITDIANEKGLTQEQLEDRVVPDCGLDVRGSRLFDYGTRRVYLALGPQLKPMIRDETGKLKSGLPRPSAKDDPTLVARAQDDWKLLKKQLAAVLKLQSDRLRKAMVQQRRWTVGDFERFLVRHPLMINFARLLIWGGYDANGKLQTTFRVSEEQRYEDVEERPASIVDAAAIGIVHPYHLPEAVRLRWGELFSDYEVIQPFPQIGRPVYRLEPGEVNETQIRRLEGIMIKGPSLVFHLENLGWSRTQTSEPFKHFPAAHVTAVIRYEPGVYGGPPSEWPDQKVTHCFFLDGQPVRTQSESALKLGTVDPLAVTEVLNDLVSLGKNAR